MKRKGISLIVLVITIVVIIILAAAVILSLGKNNPINSAKEARVASDIDSFQSELTVNLAKRLTDSLGNFDVGSVNATGDEIKEYIPSIEDKKVNGILYSDILAIENGKLVLKSNITKNDLNESIVSAIEKTLNVSVPEHKAPGFYDANGNLVTTYEDSGVDVSINGTSSMYNYLRNNTNVVEVVLPESVTSIGDDAFLDCSGLTSVTIPSSVTNIGLGAFYGCTGLTSVTIPSSVTSIVDNPFKGCIGLESIIVDPNNTVYDSRDNCNAIIQKSDNTLVLGCKNTVIPNSVTTIGEGAFDGSTGLTNITIPNSVTSIGMGAFYGCTGLTSVTILNGVTSIGNSAFRDCTGLTSVTIPNSVTSIGDGAFSGCNSLTSITIPNSVTSIGDYAFFNVGHIYYDGTATGSPWGALAIN